MNKQEFITNFSFSNAVPTDPSTKSIPAEAFATAMEEFLNDSFRGIIRVRTLELLPKAVLICPEYAAFFFKELLCYVWGRVFIEVEINSKENGLSIELIFNDENPLTDKEMRSIIKIARNAGMHISLRDNGLSLMLRYSDTAIHHVYAISVMDGRKSTLAKLREIFYCGAPYGQKEEDSSTQKAKKTPRRVIYR